MKSFRNACHAAADARPRQPEPRRHVAGQRCRRAPGSTRPVGPHRVVGTSYTTIDTLKGIRKGMPEAKINDIGVAVIGGAMRTYLLDKDELPDRVVARHDADLDPADDDPEVRRERPDGIGGFGRRRPPGTSSRSAPITLATDEADPFERLRRIVASTSHVKESGAYPVRSLMAMTEEALGGLSGTVQRTAVRALSRTGRTLAVHTLVSNVPGPITRCTSAAPRWSTLTGLGPVLDGMALNNGIGSYGDRVIFCFTADRDAMPDPEFYEDCIAGAVDELVTAAKRLDQKGRS